MRRGSSRLFWTFTLTFWFVVTFRRGPGNWLLIAITWKKWTESFICALRILHLQPPNPRGTNFSRLVAKTCEKHRVQDCILEMDHKRWFLHKPLGKKYFGHAPPKPNKRSRERKVSSIQTARTQEHISRPIKYLLQRRLQILFSEQRGLYESFGTKKSRTKRPRRDRATQIARSEKRNKGGTFKTGARRSNEPTTQNI